VANHIDYTQGTRILGLRSIRTKEVLFNLKFSLALVPFRLVIGNLRSNKQSQDRCIQFFLLCCE
jgi:hypothetical protein